MTAAPPAADLAPLSDLSGRAVLFPVRHHSPAAARLVGRLIDRLKPSAVLIEGPSDFNPRMAELFLPHRPPVAIYSYVLLRGREGQPPTRSGCYYPFCEHSPEWQAARHGHAAGAAVRFIDLPWADMVLTEAAGSEERGGANRYADRHLLRSRYLKAVCEKLGVDTFHDAWDALFELDPSLSAEAYLARCHDLCARMRLLDGEVSDHDRRREAFMADRIREALEEFAGPVLVVTGGYHSLGLFELLKEEGPKPPRRGGGASPDSILDCGIALTPYSFERLDSLTGYDAGMPNPGFYHQLWLARLRGTPDFHRGLLRDVVDHLRDRNQLVSSADLIAAETTARALAAVRGRAEVWRTDLLDGLTAALVKDDAVAGLIHPVLAAVHAVLRGGERGLLAEGTSLPPLVLDIRSELDRLRLAASGPPRGLDVNLGDPLGRDRSRVMHRLRILGIPGYALESSAVDRPAEAEFIEGWRVSWSPDFDAHCIEASRYGPALAEAAAARLAEDAAGVQRDAKLAARLLLDAALAGLDRLTDELLETVRRLIRTDADFWAVSGALGRLLFLYRYDPVLGTAGRSDVGGLLKETFARALWLLESLGAAAGKDRETLDGVRSVIDTFERCDRDLDLSRDELLDVFRRVAADRGQGPVVRGAALGGLWVLHDADGGAVTARLREFADPDRLGDFLTGLFALAREQAQRQKDLLLGVNAVLAGYSAEDFLTALPPLRLAFTFFTPREKHHLALTLRAALGLEKEPEMAALTVDVATAAEAIAFEDRLFSTIRRYGIRGDQSPPVATGGLEG